MEIRDLQEVCHQQAKDKGFYADRPNEEEEPQQLLNWQGNKIALMHSELSEALEEIRKGHAAYETYYSEDYKAMYKPSDIVSWCNTPGCEWNLKGEKLAHDATPERAAKTHRDNWTIEGTNEHHDVEWFISPVVQKPEGVPSELADVIIRILNFCGGEGIDMQEIVEEKLAYNATREFMHGKKF